MGLYVNDGKDFLIILEQLKIGFIKRVDKGRITRVKDLKSLRFKRRLALSFVRANREIVGRCRFI